MNASQCSKDVMCVQGCDLKHNSSFDLESKHLKAIGLITFSIFSSFDSSPPFLMEILKVFLCVFVDETK